MDEHRRWPLAVFIAALALVTGALLVNALSRVTAPSMARGALGIIFGSALTVSYLFPLRIRTGTKVTLGTSVLFATVLLFDPAIAMLVAGCGRLVALAVRRSSPDQAVLNTAQTMLQVAVATLLLEVGGWDPERPRLDDPALLPVLALAALAMYLVNTATVAVAVGFTSRCSPLTAWRDSVAAFDAAERLAQLGLGLTAAAVAYAVPWALPLLLLPALAVYRLGERSSDLEHRATHDALTGLPNRTSFLDGLQKRIGRESPGAGAVAILYLDLDNLKSVNDTLGHRAGDEALRQAAARLQRCLRPVDLVARLGGDEFAVLLGEAAAPSEAANVALRVLHAMDEPVVLNGRPIAVSWSIGVALGEGIDAYTKLLDMADAAMYRAKAAGKASFRLSHS